MATRRRASLHANLDLASGGRGAIGNEGTRRDARDARRRVPPRVTVTLCDLAIGLIRQVGYTGITVTIRKIRYGTVLLIATRGLTAPS